MNSPHRGHPGSGESLVSILVRSMDRSTLQRALDSIAAQDHPRIEIVVVAACGTAHRELPARVGEFPLRLIRPGHPLPRAEAANATLDAARGDWLNLLDDDDELLPMHVSTLCGALAAQPEALLAYSRSYAVGVGGGRTEFGAKFRPWRQLDTGFFHSQSALFSRTLIDAGARFDPRFDILEDMDFFVQCAQRSPPLFVDAITSVSHRDVGTSGTGSARDDARIAAAIARLRSKWAALEQQLHRSREFRLDKTIWLLDHRQIAAAEAELASLRADYPDCVDVLMMSAFSAAHRGDGVEVRAWLIRVDGREPRTDAVRERLPAIRAMFRDRP